MRIQYLYDDGCPKGESRRYPEDEAIWCPRGGDEGVYGVLDGASFYDPSQSPPLYDGLTPGQLAARTVLQTFNDAQETSGEPLVQTITRANGRLGAMVGLYGFSFDKPELLPAAAIAVAKVHREQITISSTTDCFAVWEKKDGSFGVTLNLALDYELEVERKFAEIKKKHGGSLERAWKEWLPIRADMLRRYRNKPDAWAMITGEPEFAEALWETVSVPRGDVSLLILATDGFTTTEASRNPLQRAEKWRLLYEQGGLSAILQDSRKEQEKNLAGSHETSFPEATAIALEF